MPRLALQYRLCEVGTYRLDHELLPFQLNGAERSGDIVMLEQDIYALPNIRRFDTQNDAKHDLLKWGIATHSNELDELKRIISATLSQNNFEVQHLHSTTTDRCRHLGIQTRNGPASIMLSLKESAITVDDPVFWQFLAECALQERQPYILARTVSKATFPVLKALGARAFQFYFIPLHSELAEKETLYQAEADELGMPPIKLTSKWSAHPVHDVLIKQLKENQPGMQTVAARQAISLAATRDFDKTRVSPKKIRRWATDIETRYAIKLPQNWSIMMKHWTELEREHGEIQAIDA